jgi:ubiquinone/menaquinone biosynthesis C-methylase UbiE
VRKMLAVVFGALVGALLVAAYRLYAGRQIGRTPSVEGIEDAGVAAGFARVAKLPPLRLLRWVVIRRALRLQPWGEAVDLGCGPGHLAIELARAAPSLHVTGVDLSNALLAEAILHAAQADAAHRVQFRTADAADTPFPDASFDLAVSTLSLHHWSDPVPILDEVQRILKPGGAFVIFDLRRDMIPPAYVLVAFVTRFIVPRVLRAAREPLGSRDAAYTPPEAAELAQASRLTGWRIANGPFWLAIEGRKID